MCMYVCTRVCVCVGAPNDYKGLGMVDHRSSGDRGVCVYACVCVFTGMRALACQYMLICQKRRRVLLVPLRRK